MTASKCKHVLLHSIQTKCFICGIGNDYFDRTPHGFETHTLQEHNLANYLWVQHQASNNQIRYIWSIPDFIHNTLPHVCRFFLMYLINKDETEHTGQVCDNLISSSLNLILSCIL